MAATNRRPERAASLAARGVDHPIVDTGCIVDRVRTLLPEGAVRVHHP